MQCHYGCHCHCPWDSIEDTCIPAQGQFLREHCTDASALLFRNLVHVEYPDQTWLGRYFLAATPAGTLPVLCRSPAAPLPLPCRYSLPLLCRYKVVVQQSESTSLGRWKASGRLFMCSISYGWIQNAANGGPDDELYLLSRFASG
eukprot:gene17316-biopygen12362